MAEIKNRSENNLNNLSEEEKRKMHEGYSALGKKGGQKGGQTRAQQLGHEGYVELGHKGGQKRAEQLGHEGYVELGHKGGTARAKQMAQGSSGSEEEDIE